MFKGSPLDLSSGVNELGPVLLFGQLDMAWLENVDSGQVSCELAVWDIPISSWKMSL
ncbi:hypothetical protein SLEP1_g16785 [Rubroshorea leprosula]|uniref:Uncharacterized protein n=1 Tax=Rubroshorea leprosula TaxID=152421 RepID=A0AAV5IRZ1_9ROSI|nr:hypothetical protein SLEP1_g16785 [Rubroshorea leprosula]